MPPAGSVTLESAGVVRATAGRSRSPWLFVALGAAVATAVTAAILWASLSTPPRRSTKGGDRAVATGTSNGPTEPHRESSGSCPGVRCVDAPGDGNPVSVEALLRASIELAQDHDPKAELVIVSITGVDGPRVLPKTFTASFAIGNKLAFVTAAKDQLALYLSEGVTKGYSTLGMPKCPFETAYGRAAPKLARGAPMTALLVKPLALNAPTAWQFSSGVGSMALRADDCEPVEPH